MVVLDANILIRAVLGRRVREILEAHSTRTRFFAPDTAIAEAREHLPEILLATAPALECPIWTEDADSAPETVRSHQHSAIS